MGQANMDELRARITGIVDRELPDKVLAPVDRLLTDFGLLPADYALADDYPELLTSQVAGFYDPIEKTLVLADRPGGLLGPEMAQRFGPRAAARILRVPCPTCPTSWRKSSRTLLFQKMSSLSFGRIWFPPF